MRVSMSPTGSFTGMSVRPLARPSSGCPPPGGPYRARRCRPRPPGRADTGVRAADVLVLLLPGTLDEPRHLSLECPLPQTDPAHLELAQECARPPAQWAAVVLAHRELRLALRLGNLRKLGHSRRSLYWRNGMPKWRSSASPCSSFSAVVTKLMFSPFTFSIWS